MKNLKPSLFIFLFYLGMGCAKSATHLPENSPCPTEWKEVISRHPYDDGRQGHIGYLLINPKFPRKDCYCEIHPKTLAVWYSHNQSIDELTDWITQCYVRRAFGTPLNWGSHHEYNASLIGNVQSVGVRWREPQRDFSQYLVGMPTASHSFFHLE